MKKRVRRWESKSGLNLAAYRAVMATTKKSRAARVLALRADGLTAGEIHEATGWTYRQQLYAVKALEEASHGRT